MNTIYIYDGEVVPETAPKLLLFTVRHIPLNVDINIENEIIRTKSSIKYLEQTQYSANKAQKIVGKLSRLPLPATLRLPMNVDNSVMLYGN